MRSSFTPEQVDRIENKAYEVGISVGTGQEQRRIIALLEDYIPTFYKLSANEDAGKYPIEHLIALIKGEN